MGPSMSSLLAARISIWQSVASRSTSISCKRQDNMENISRHPSGRSCLMIFLIGWCHFGERVKIPWPRKSSFKKSEDHCRDLAGVELADAMKELALQRSNKVGVVYAVFFMCGWICGRLWTSVISSDCRNWHSREALVRQEMSPRS